MKKKATKKRNYGATEGTWRNVRAAKKRNDTLKMRVVELEEFVGMLQVVVTILIKRLDKLERKRGRK